MTLTKQDIETLRGIFATKGELAHCVESLEKAIQGLRNEMMTNFDRVFGKLEDLML